MRAVILGNARTPFGRLGGALSPLTATTLGGEALRQAVARARIDPDRDAKDLRGIHTGSDDEVVHLGVRHLYPVNARSVTPERLVGAIELRVAGRARTAVEVAKSEPVRRVEPARLERSEVVVMENGLTSCEARPVGGGDPVTEPPCRVHEPRAVVVDRPAEVVADHEQTRRVRPL